MLAEVARHLRQSPERLIIWQSQTNLHARYGLDRLFFMAGSAYITGII
jgi:hypothetical protein